MPDPIPAIPPRPSLDALTKKQNAAKIDQFLSWSSLNRLDVWGKQPDTAPFLLHPRVNCILFSST